MLWTQPLNPTGYLRMRPRNDVDAAFMSQERRGSGIHAVWPGKRGVRVTGVRSHARALSGRDDKRDKADRGEPSVAEVTAASAAA
jgi:hypothetical protein